MVCSICHYIQLMISKAVQYFGTFDISILKEAPQITVTNDCHKKQQSLIYILISIFSTFGSAVQVFYTLGKMSQPVGQLSQMCQLRQKLALISQYYSFWLICVCFLVSRHIQVYQLTDIHYIPSVDQHCVQYSVCTVHQFAVSLYILRSCNA